MSDRIRASESSGSFKPGAGWRGVEKSKPAGRASEIAAAAPLLDEAGLMLMGLSSECFIGIKLIRRVNSSTDQVVNECANCMGHIGFRRGMHRLPLAFSWHTMVGGLLPQSAFLRLDGSAPSEPGKGTLLHEFSSSPLPVMHCRQIGEYLHQTVEFEEAAAGRCDIFTAHRHVQYVSRADVHVGEYYSICPRVPTRRYVEDIWVHDSMPLVLEPTSAIYFPCSRVMGGHPETREFDKIATLPPPSPLGRGIGQSRMDSFASHQQLTAHMFARMGWRPEEFRGFRLLVEQPLWGLEYVTHFAANE